MLVKALLVTSLFLETHVLGHSWLHCSKYTATISGQDFSDDNCEGYIRRWQSKWGAPAFSADLGINYFGSNGAWCQGDGIGSPISSMYTDDYPAAEWYVGETVRLVWPAKNHANYECFNNIPDNSMKLYYMPSPDQTSDGTTLGTDWVVLTDFQEDCTPGTDGCGFQNCPKFCEDTDGAPCYGEYTVESSKFSSDGYYTIMWYWIFNTGSAAYTTCFEVYVNTGVTAPTQSPTPSPVSSPASSEDSTDSDSDTDTDNGYADFIIQIPICYSGATYNEDTLIDGANNQFEDDSDVSFSVISVSQQTTVFNATIQTETDDVQSVSASARDDQVICDSIESAFGSGNCRVCDEGAIKVYTISSGTSDSETSDSDTSDSDTEDSDTTSSGSSGGVRLDLSMSIIILTIACFIFVL